MDILAIITLASAAFFATNLDNMILLTTFLNRHKENKTLLYTGYILAISIAIGGSYAAGTLIDELPLEYLGYLGSISLLLGLYGLWQLFLNQELDAIQHRLNEQNSSVKKIVDSTRHQLSVSYQEQKHLSAKEIAYSLGFNDPSNFSRAFRRWEGITPKEYRKAG